MIKGSYQCGIAVFQLAKLRMLESYYDFLNEYFSRQDFELCYMDTDSFYLEWVVTLLDEIVKAEMRQAYQVDKKNWLAADEYSERTPGLFKPEFIGTRGMWLTAKCYFVQNEAEKNKYNCKGVSKNHNNLNFERYKDLLDVFLKTRIDRHWIRRWRYWQSQEFRLRVYDQGIVTYEQNKPYRLSAYCDNRYVSSHGIQTRPLDF